MKLWRISQDVNNGYGTYDSAVVAAEDEDGARKIHPSTYEGGKWWRRKESHGTWALSLDQVAVEFIGHAQDDVKAGVICASFNAG